MRFFPSGSRTTSWTNWLITSMVLLPHRFIIFARFAHQCSFFLLSMAVVHQRVTSEMQFFYRCSCSHWYWHCKRIDWERSSSRIFHTCCKHWMPPCHLARIRKQKHQIKNVAMCKNNKAANIYRMATTFHYATGFRYQKFRFDPGTCSENIYRRCAWGSVFLFKQWKLQYSWTSGCSSTWKIDEWMDRAGAVDFWNNWGKPDGSIYTLKKRAIQYQRIVWVKLIGLPFN